MDSLCIILIGLGLDIAGAIVIVSPLLRLVKRNHPNGDPRGKGESLGFADIDHRYVEDKSAQNTAWIGMILLIAGFILQAIGNIISNMNN